ncbi:hypothetical protein P3T18_002771 [Paraburkholderia sp. GAS199]|uniref:hypothetical protein n=1 Tax=Paraburkholderia sp. GAS199 TaxID=3035126 RepID=UPI003D1ECF7D
MAGTVDIRHGGGKTERAKVSTQTVALTAVLTTTQTAADRTGHRLSPDEVRFIIEAALAAVYEGIFERKAVKMIWSDGASVKRRTGIQ